MNPVYRFLPRLSPATLIIVGVAAGIAFLIGPLMRLGKIGTREMVILIFGFAMAILVLIPSKRVLKLGMVIWIVTFGLGWRTIHVTSILSIHPAVVLAVLLFVGTLIHDLLYRRHTDFSISIWIPLLTLFAFLGMLTAYDRGTPVDLILQESQVFLALIPAYYVIRWNVETQRDWENVARWLIVVAVYVSCLGLLDLVAPDVSRRLSGNESIDTVYMTTQGIGRAMFIFYGSPIAGFLIYMFFGLTAHFFLTSLQHGGIVRWISALALLAELAGIYLCGYRGAYYALGVFLLVYAVILPRAKILLAAGIAGLPLLPEEFYLRVISLIDTRYADSSQFKRIDRATQAFDLVKQFPLTGVGFGGSGYVHSDFVQIAANLGVPALGIFLVWIASVMWRLFRIARQANWIGEYAGALFATFCGLLVTFAGEGLIVLPQLMVPIWFMVSMALKLVDLHKQAEAPSRTLAT